MGEESSVSRSGGVVRKVVVVGERWLWWGKIAVSAEAAVF